MCINLAEISYRTKVIANFVPNVVATATEVGRGKMRLAAFDGPNTPIGAKISHEIFYLSRVIVIVCQISPPWQRLTDSPVGEFINQKGVVNFEQKSAYFNYI